MVNIKRAFFLAFIIIFIIFGCVCYNNYRYYYDFMMPDVEYKKAVVRDSHNLSYTVEGLHPLMGPGELMTFLAENNNSPEIYTPSKENIEKGIFRANMHMHTTNSDGIANVEEFMDKAQEYAEKNIENKYMLIAITDHNTVLGAKEAIRVMQKNKGKYKNLKVLPGIEIFTEYKNSNVADNPVEIHVLTLAINPYDKFLNKEFYKKDLNDKLNRTRPDRDFNQVIKTMSNYGIVGVAHPARYTSRLNEKKYDYITEMLTRYSKLNPKTLFVEGYYQSYEPTNTAFELGDEYEKYILHINSEAERLGILRSGGTDAHGKSIFTNR